MVRLRATSPLLVAAAMFAGCSDSTGPGGAPGTATGEITGSVNRSISGMATFGLGSAFGTEAFTIVIADTDGEVVVGVVLEEGGRPGTGTYSLGHLETSPRYGEAAIGSAWYESDTGELRVTSSSAQSLQGTVSFSARRVGGQGQINVSATFNAMCIPGGWFTCD